MENKEPCDICDICDGKHKKIMAVKWCPECQEKLCEDCHINHSLSKLLRHHVVIDIKDYRKIPDSLLEIKIFCNQHDMKYSNLCPQHDKLCCPACTTGSGSHSGCRTLLIQDVIQTTNTPSLLKPMEINLKSLTKNIEAIIKDRQTNIRQLHNQQIKIETNIKQTKETILKHLDVMEGKIMEDLNSRVKQYTTNLQSEVEELEKRLKKSEDLLKSTTALLDLGSDLQTYIGSKTMEAEVARETNSLYDLVNSGNIKQYGLRFQKYSKDILTVQDEKMFGRVSVDVSAVSFALTSELNKQAQIMSSPSALSINDIKLSLKNTFQISGDKNYIYGCSVLSSGGVVLANNARSCVVILNENGDVEKKIKVSRKPYDLTMLDNNTMAVSSGDGIEVMNINTGNIERTIPIRKCRGVEHYNGSLICGVTGKGVISVDLTNNSMTTLVQDTEYSDDQYCSVYSDKIYVSRIASNTISCYSISGNMLWEYKDTSVIPYPTGIAVDNCSNVFVASYTNNSVVILSPQGKKCRTLLTGKDGIKWPTGVHFNRSNNQLMVVNRLGNVFLFDIM